MSLENLFDRGHAAAIVFLANLQRRNASFDLIKITQDKEDKHLVEDFGEAIHNTRIVAKANHDTMGDIFRVANACGFAFDDTEYVKEKDGTTVFFLRMASSTNHPWGYERLRLQMGELYMDDLYHAIEPGPNATHEQSHVLREGYSIPFETLRGIIYELMELFFTGKVRE